MTQAISKDTRSPQLITAHSNLAKAYLEVQNETVRAALKAHPDLMKPEIRLPESPTVGYQYKAQVSYGGFIFLVVTVNFYDPNSGQYLGYFEGKAGGLAVGGGDTWGTAWMNEPITSLFGTDATFNANFAAVATNVNLFDGSGNGLGTVAAGGVGVGIGVVGGKGSFTAA